MRKIEIKGQMWDQTPSSGVQKENKNIKVEANEWSEVKEKTITKNEENVKVARQTWEPITGLQAPKSIRSFDGVNKLESFAIKDSHATRNKNVTTAKYPALSIRGGYSLLFDTGSYPIDGMAVYKGSELHIVSGGEWRRYKSGAWTTLKSGLNQGEKWSFINFQGGFTTMHLIATNGIDPALKYDGTTVANLANAPTGSDYIATHDNRVYIAAKSMVHFSALRKAEDWTTVDEAGQIAVETTDGKDITGIIAGSARLTVFKENSIHELFGTNPSNFVMKTVAENLGSPTGYSAQVIGGVIYFLGSDGVYRYSGGSLPDKEFSLPIQDYIRKIDSGRAKLSISWSDGQRYYLGICIGSTQPNTILEYDPIFQSWNVWDFAPKMAVCGVMWNGVYYGGNESGEVMKFDSLTDNTTPISYEWVTKPFSTYSLAAKNRWYRLWIVADIPSGSTMNIHLSGKEDGESWTLVKSIAVHADVQAQEIHIPVGVVSFSNFIRLRIEGTGPVTIYEISRQERVFPLGLS